MSTNRIYVNNLPFSITESSLVEFFSQIGEVVSAEIFTMHNGRSKGCALITFAADDSATRAIAELNEQDLEGRPLHIREDRGEGVRREFREPREAREPRQTREFREPRQAREPREPREPREFREPREPREPRQNRHDDAGRKIFIGNLSYRTEWQTLKDLFRECGEVIRADVAKGADGRSRGYGTVVFADEESAQRAISQKHDFEFEGRPITVRLDRDAQRRD